MWLSPTKVHHSGQLNLFGDLGKRLEKGLRSAQPLNETSVTPTNPEQRKHLYMFVYQLAVEGFLCIKVKVHSKGRLLARVQKLCVPPSSFSNCRLKTQLKESDSVRNCRFLVTLSPLPFPSTVKLNGLPVPLNLSTNQLVLLSIWVMKGGSS